jgi:hypothetical protein
MTARFALLALLALSQSQFHEEERCPLRDCKFGDWVTRTPVVIRKDRTENLRGVARLAPGTRVQVLQHITVVGNNAKEWWVKVGDPKGRIGWTNQVQLFDRDPFTPAAPHDVSLNADLMASLDKAFPGWELSPACRDDYQDVRALPGYGEGDFDGDGIDDRVVIIVNGPGRVRMRHVLAFLTRGDGMHMYRAWEGVGDRATLLIGAQPDGSDVFAMANCDAVRMGFSWTRYGFKSKLAPIDIR